MLNNEVLYLRPVEPEDLELLYQVENDASLWWIGGQNGGYSRFMLRQYIAGATGDIYSDKQMRFIAVRKVDEVPVGIFDFFEFSPIHMRAEVGILVFSNYRKQGYGTAMLSLAEKFAGKQIKLHQLYAFVPVWNDASVELFRKNQYTQEHLLKDWISTEKGFSDALLFQKML